MTFHFSGNPPTIFPILDNAIHREGGIDFVLVNSENNNEWKKDFEYQWRRKNNNERKKQKHSPVVNVPIFDRLEIRKANQTRRQKKKKKNSGRLYPRLISCLYCLVTLLVVRLLAQILTDQFYILGPSSTRLFLDFGPKIRRACSPSVLRSRWWMMDDW